MFERQIATQLGVSRTPVREALAMLETEDLVRSEPNRGTLVRRVSPSEVRETYEVRAVLEAYAASLAAEFINRRDLGRLRRIHRDMTRTLEGEDRPEDVRASDLASLNAEFHLTIAEATRNEVLNRTIQSLIETPLHARAYFWYADQSKAASISDHERIIELLERGDAHACQEFWRGHLYRGRDYIVDYLETREETP